MMDKSSPFVAHEKSSKFVTKLTAKSTARAGFTLPEMLTVIAIVMVVIAMLLPALGESKQAAYDAICKNNLHQIMITMSGFRANNHGGASVLPSPYGWQTYVESTGAALSMRCPMDGREEDKAGGEVNGSSTINYLPTPPPDVRFNTPEVESNTQIFVFRERESFPLPKAIKIDIDRPGFYDQFTRIPGTTIPAGTRVDSFFAHFDSVGRQGVTSSGTITVGGQIIGLIVNDGTLNTTDTIVGAEGTTYSTGQGARGFENRAEQVTLTDDLKTVEINRFKISFPGEEMRIITVPGGFSSYGMNNQVPQRKWARGSQALFVEYDKSIVDVDGLNGNNDDFDYWLAKRHYKKSNVMRGDGSQSLMTQEELDPTNANADEIWEYDPN
jgi:prepilin-type N-terminal cleavage/methylation domain-containing protein